MDYCWETQIVVKSGKQYSLPLQGVLPAMFDNKMTVYNVKRTKTLIMPGKDSKINHDTVLKISKCTLRIMQSTLALLRSEIACDTNMFHSQFYIYGETTTWAYRHEDSAPH